MPLEPQPPPSPPVGKVPPHTKHVCPPSSPCAILLSEVGKRYHAFPKGTFKARFSPPVVPKAVLHHLSTHPPTWSWTTKAGPKAGKSFHVPTVPTSCGKDSHRAIHWIVSIFHAFKSQLALQALDDKGRVLPAYIKLYQNNMLVHLRAQQALLARQAKLPSMSRPQPAQPTQTPSQPIDAVIAELKAEIASLRSDLEASRCTCRASSSSSTSGNPSPPSSPAIHWSPTPSPPSPLPPSNVVRAHVPYSGPAWLQRVLDHPQCPPLIHPLTPTTYPILQYTMCSDATLIVRLDYERAPSKYLGVASDGNLYLSEVSPTQQESGVITMSILSPLPPRILRSKAEEAVLRH